MGKFVAALLLILTAPAFAQNSGPLPQTGLEHPEAVKGAKENGAMAPRDKGKGTTGMNKRSPNRDPVKK